MRFISGVHHIPPHPYPLPKEREPVATHRVKAAKRSHGGRAEVRPLLGERVGVRGNAAHEYSIADPVEVSRNTPNYLASNYTEYAWQSLLLRWVQDIEDQVSEIGVRHLFKALGHHR